jgi:hypothetical protein
MSAITPRSYPKQKPFIVTHKPVGVGCPACHKAKRLHGVMFRLTLSRLEEGLGHEGFECDKCGERIKYVPKEIR